jgi:hypothetical protein
VKLGRRCQLSVEINPRAEGDRLEGSNTLTIPQDITIEFEISRQFLSSSQEATFRILNLSQETRDRLNKDAYAMNEFRAIQFKAGYEDFPLPIVFNGFVRHASSYRRGTEMVTEISCYDGGISMASGFTARTIAGGTSIQDLLKQLAQTLPRIAGAPLIGEFPKTNLRGKVLMGNTWSIILQESGNLATIDNGQVKILNLNEAIGAGIPLIDASAGLLGSPRRTPTKLEFTMLFEPRLTIGQIVELQSSTNRLYNGTYKVTGFNHRGTISPVVSGECSSVVSLFFGIGEFNIVRGAVVQ